MKCPYSELIWSTFPCIRTEYEETLRLSPYSVRIRENADQNNSKYRHFSRCEYDYESLERILNLQAEDNLTLKLAPLLLFEKIYYFACPKVQY